MAPRYVFATPPGNPLMQALYLIVGTVLVIGAILMGAVILAFVIGVGLVLGLVLWVRIWWLRRKFRRGQAGDSTGGTQADTAASRSQDGVEITQVAYHVARETRRDDD